MFFAPRFHEFHRSFVEGVFDSCRGPVSHHSPEAQDGTCEAAGALIALRRFEFPEYPDIPIFLKMPTLLRPTHSPGRHDVSDGNAICHRNVFSSP